jgi:uncharacterized protein (DUF305 family)
MTTHHAQGIELANLAVSRASDPHLRSLAMLMVASQTGEVRIFERWWRSWFDAPMPLCSASERAAMPGLLSDGQMQQIKSAPLDQFDTLFIHLMSIHHAGAVLAWPRRSSAPHHGARDPPRTAGRDPPHARYQRL